MRKSRFDQLAKAFACCVSRRDYLKATITVLLASAVRQRGTARPFASGSAAAEELPPLEYFALGDSVASGHGLMDDGTDCRRSGLAYPYEVLIALDAHYTVPVVHHLACSGATTSEPKALTDPDKWFRNQVDEVERQLREEIPTDRPVLISITIGANDLGWLSPELITHLVEDDAAFQSWVEKTTAGVATEVRTQVQRLLPFPNVVVVVTQYHNPVNHDSSVFRVTDQFLKTTCNDLFNPGKCYRRTEEAIHALNDALVFQVLEPLGSPPHLRVTPTLHESFHLDGGHEGPGALGAPVGPGICGFAPPGVANTWVQWPGDPSSNAVGFLGGHPLRGFRGDCFHPNEAGAQEFANAVIEQAFAVLLATSPSVSSYNVIDLGTLGGPSSSASGINDADQIVGSAFTAQGLEHAFLWQDGQMTDLGTLGGLASWASDLNDAGQIVGWASTSAGVQHAFLWESSQMTDFGTLGGAESAALAINNAGQVVGWAETTTGAKHAVLWQDGQMMDLGTLGGLESGAVGMNDAGQIVGSSDTADGGRHAVLWENGQVTDLGTLGNAKSGAYAINDAGQIVGSADTAYRDWHALLWENGQMMDLGVQGDGWILAEAVNDLGQIVGSTSTQEQRQDPRGEPMIHLTWHAYLWQDGQITALQTPDGAESRASAINESGGIVGWANTGDGVQHAALWETGKPRGRREGK